MESIKIGFLGFGEVASTFSKPMLERGADIAAYDVLLLQDGGRDMLQRRTQVEGIRFRSLRNVVANADCVLSTVTTQAAKDVAKECATHLTPSQMYVDLNSMAPSHKLEIAKIIQPSGAHFVEGAILGAVGATGARTHILIGGSKGKRAAEILTVLGLHATFYSSEIGKASMFKMLRSIFSKGLEALILEFLIAGKRAGIEQDLWEDVVDFMTHNSFDRVASNWVQTHAVAHERRYHEMVQVVETMREIGVEPIMASGTEAFFKRSLALGLKETFAVKPDSMKVVVDLMEERLR